MTEKEARKELIKRANEINPTVHIGKDGLDEGVFNEITAQLKNSRLIKIRVLSSSEGNATETAAAIAAATNSAVVDVRGGVIILTDMRTWTSLSQKKF